MVIVHLEKYGIWVSLYAGSNFRLRFGLQLLDLLFKSLDFVLFFDVPYLEVVKLECLIFLFLERVFGYFEPFTGICLVPLNFL